MNQGSETTVAPGRTGRFGQSFDIDQLAASPDYLFQVSVSGQGGAPSCSVRVRVEVSACLLTCDYDNVGPNSRAKLVYRPGN